MDELNNYNKIAFDLDGTLVDGNASARFASFIKKNSEKTYFIVTFRTSSEISTIPEELENMGLSADMFAKIIPMPKQIMFDFNEDQKTRRAASLPNLDMVSSDALLPGEYKFMHWKGYVTRKLGATVLVDDMPELSKLGCKQFGVKLINAKTIR